MDLTRGGHETRILGGCERPDHVYVAPLFQVIELFLQLLRILQGRTGACVGSPHGAGIEYRVVADVDVTELPVPARQQRPALVEGVEAEVAQFRDLAGGCGSNLRVSAV